MAIVRPFKGVRYNLENVLLKKVIAPPYDVISEEYREELLHKSPYNVVKIDLPVGENKYHEAASTYVHWKHDGIFIKDNEPTFYVYEQEYEFDGKHYSRIGFVGLLKLEEFGKTVFPHEKTLAGPKQDRFDLMTASKANFSQIFGLYLDPDNRLESLFSECHHQMPLESVIDDDGVKHSVWGIHDQADIDLVESIMRDKAIYIADGHHRYETALMYRDKMREMNNDKPDETKPYDYVMMMFVNFYDSGLMVFPTHRVVDVPQNFDVEKFKEQLKGEFVVNPVNDEEAEKFLETSKEPGSMVVVTREGNFAISLDQEKLDSMHPIYRNVDTYLLQKNILTGILNIPEEQILAKKGIYFYQTKKEVEDKVNSGSYVGFIMRGTSIDVIRQVSENGLVMPQKSTFFYPKLATGLLFNEL